MLDHNVQGRATAVGRTLSFPDSHSLGALVMLFTRCGDFCPKVQSRETALC